MTMVWQLGPKGSSCKQYETKKKRQNARMYVTAGGTAPTIASAAAMLFLQLRLLLLLPEGPSTLQ